MFSSQQRITLFIIIFLIGTLILVIVALQFIQKNTQTETTIAPSPTVLFPTTVQSIKKTYPYKTVQSAPTLLPTQGLGIDINSSIIQTSQNEIKKLVSNLPYKKTLTLEGIDIYIVIPPPDLQENPWTLTVQIFGIDYATPQTDPTFTSQKNNFLQAVQDVNTWIQSNGVNPQNIIIKWGDKLFIQQRAEEWLSS
jgi:hypothetical protein